MMRDMHGQAPRFFFAPREELCKGDLPGSFSSRARIFFGTLNAFHQPLKFFLLRIVQVFDQTVLVRAQTRSDDERLADSRVT